MSCETARLPAQFSCRSPTLRQHISVSPHQLHLPLQPTVHRGIQKHHWLPRRRETQCSREPWSAVRGGPGLVSTYVFMCGYSWGCWLGLTGLLSLKTQRTNLSGERGQCVGCPPGTTTCSSSSCPSSCAWAGSYWQRSHTDQSRYQRTGGIGPTDFMNQVSYYFIILI